MSSETCGEMRLLIQADADGELSPAEAARVAVHVEHCPACAAAQDDLVALSAKLRALPRETAPKRLEAAILARVAAERTVPRVRKVPRIPVFGMMPAFGGGFALAACLAWLVLVPAMENPADDLISAHIRALQPGHLMDVVSTDQHTVKPWFDGKLPFAPPVKELKSVGFPLAGGRLDYVAGHLAAALVYTRGAHDINLFVWPSKDIAPPSQGSKDRYHFERWTADGMTFWAISDLNAGELADFATHWRAM
jgi:anti-sigma factor RsiW